jgi:hypothetical protein
MQIQCITGQIYYATIQAEQLPEILNYANDNNLRVEVVLSRFGGRYSGTLAVQMIPIETEGHTMIEV